MRRLLRAWVELWDRREPPTVLALVRILVGVVLLADLLQVAGHGLVDALWAPPSAGGLGIGAVDDARGPWVIRWLGASSGTAWTLWTLATLAAAALAAGLATRVAAVVFVLISAQLALIAPDSDRGIDILLRVVVGVLAFSHSHAIWSLDALIWRKLGRPPPALVPAWPRYLLFAQMVWLYFSAGTAKTQPEWTPGGGFHALGSILADPHFASFDPGWLRVAYPLTVLGTAATVLFEWGAPGFLLAFYFHATRERAGRLRWLSNKLRLRWVWLATGVSFHLGIALTMRLGIFPWGTLAIYPVFLHPDELARAVTWARAAARRLAGRAAPRSSSGPA